MIFLPQDQQVQIPDDVKQYLELIIDDAGLVLTDDLREAMIADLFSRLEKKVIADAIEKMEPEDVEELTRKMEASAPQQEIEAYINEHLPNAQDVFVQSLAEFRAFFLEGTTVANTNGEG